MNHAPEQDPTTRDLRSWQVAPRRNPNFRSETWARIEAARASSAIGWWAYIRRYSAGWALAFVVTLSAAGAGGWWVAERRNAHDREAIVAMYVTAIDARAMVASTP